MVVLDQGGRAAYNLRDALAVRLVETAGNKKFENHKEFAYVIAIYFGEKGASLLAGYETKEDAEDSFYGLLRAFASGIAVYDLNGVLSEDDDYDKDQTVAELDDLIKAQEEELKEEEQEEEIEEER